MVSTRKWYFFTLSTNLNRTTFYYFLYNIIFPLKIVLGQFDPISRGYVEINMHESKVNSYYIFQVIHGKLSSFCVSVTSANRPKISCFGCVFNSRGMKVDLNRWSAPEVLRFQFFSIQSDVWSFGCLMWECCSLGGTLFSSINSNDLCLRIKNGALPEKISYVFDDMNQLLLNCWQLEPSERPSCSGTLQAFCSDDTYYP